MKISGFIAALLFTLFFSACAKEESRTCTTCSSVITASFEVCREPDGTASVNDENTGVAYNTYLEALQQEGANCGN